MKLISDESIKFVTVQAENCLTNGAIAALYKKLNQDLLARLKSAEKALKNSKVLAEHCVEEYATDLISKSINRHFDKLKGGSDESV